MSLEISLQMRGVNYKERGGGGYNKSFLQHKKLFLAFLTLFLNVFNARSIFELKKVEEGETFGCWWGSLSMKI